MIKPLEIAVGIIRDPLNNQIFITQRQEKSYLAGYWEFPGGKIELDETAELGLARELAEELGIEVIQPVLLKSLTYSYPEKTLVLHFFIVEQWQGEPYGKEGQAARWLAVADLKADEFPEANRSIVSLIQKMWGKASY